MTTNTVSNTVNPQSISYSSSILARHVVKAYENLTLRSGLYLGDVSVEGYSASDLDSYYTGTVMLHECNKRLDPVNVHHIEFESNGEAMAVCKRAFFNSEGIIKVDVKRIKLDTLKRFLITPSFVLTATKGLVYVRYDCRKSYKKSAVMGMVRVVNIHDEPVANSVEHVLRVIFAWLYPVQRSICSQHQIEIISNNLLRINNTVKIPYKMYRVGSYEDKTLNTPYEAVTDRYNDYKAAVLEDEDA